MKTKYYAKVIGNDFRRNPINYAMLLLSIIVCAAASLFLFRTIRMNVSTNYDAVYSFQFKNIEKYEEAQSIYDNLKTDGGNNYSLRGKVFLGGIDYEAIVNGETYNSGAQICLVAGGEVKNYSLLKSEYKVYVPTNYLGTDSKGNVRKIGDNIEILGTLYEIVGINPFRKMVDAFYISSKYLPANFDYSMLQPITLAFKKRLSNAQLAQFESLGLKQIADDNHPDVVVVTSSVIVSLLTMFFAFLIAAGVLRQNASDMAKLRLLGGRRVGVAAANAIMLSLFFVVGFFIAVAIDAAVAAVYDYEGKVPFEDALRIEDFVIEFVFLASVFAAFMTARFFAKSGRISEELKG